MVQLYKNGYKVSLDMPLLASKMYDDVVYDEPVDECIEAYKEEPQTGMPYRCETSKNCECVTVSKMKEGRPVFQNRRFLKMEKKFAEIENAGTDVSYRCVKCRDCQNCKTNDRIEKISIKEEVEQHLIDRSVKVNIEKCETIAKLPFTHDPTTRLSPNQHVAMKIYKSQINKLQQCPSDKSDVINAEKKLQQMGFVDFVDNLPSNQKSMIMSSEVNHFIPWRAVWNLNSLSTRCRLVFDASMKTNGT